ncbi:MAG: YmdB family metallophosphoesterase, partial [Candidatus Aminicenantes bacterium]|nr:YmdB family metallophosphoesterase [Candidatus Aminicenantes bacterium]
AYLTDVGMAGAANSVIGMKREQALEKFLTALPQRFEPAKDGLFLSAAVVVADSATGRALSITREIFREETSDE